MLAEISINRTWLLVTGSCMGTFTYDAITTAGQQIEAARVYLHAPTEKAVRDRMLQMLESLGVRVPESVKLKRMEDGPFVGAEMTKHGSSGLFTDSHRLLDLTHPFDNAGPVPPLPPLLTFQAGKPKGGKAKPRRPKGDAPNSAPNVSGVPNIPNVPNVRDVPALFAIPKDPDVRMPGAPYVMNRTKSPKATARTSKTSKPVVPVEPKTAAELAEEWT